jgi:hypothetical protein
MKKPMEEMPAEKAPKLDKMESFLKNEFINK